MAGNEIFRYPDWMRDAGYFLISIESGCGVRVRLNRFYKARPVGCGYTKSYEYPMQDIHLLEWPMYLCGPFDELHAVPCTDLMHDMMFYQPLGADYVVPSIDEYPLVELLGGAVIQEHSLVEYYITRDLTYKMQIGKYYVGFVTPKYLLSQGGQTLLRQPPRVPPSFFFVHDAFAAYSDNSGLLELPL